MLRLYKCVVRALMKRIARLSPLFRLNCSTLGLYSRYRPLPHLLWVAAAGHLPLVCRGLGDVFGEDVGSAMICSR